jgi:hypothetical protein
MAALVFIADEAVTGGAEDYNIHISSSAPVLAGRLSKHQ